MSFNSDNEFITSIKFTRISFWFWTSLSFQLRTFINICSYMRSCASKSQHCPRVGSWCGFSPDSLRFLPWFSSSHWFDGYSFPRAFFETVRCGNSPFRLSSCQVATMLIIAIVDFSISFLDQLINWSAVVGPSNMGKSRHAANSRFAAKLDEKYC